MRSLATLAAAAAALSLASASASTSHSSSAKSQPNIVLLITDDQDVEMRSLDYMPKLRQYIGEQGITFNKMYASTPVCCPSRSALISGMYQHNNHVIANSIPANCSSPAWQQGPEKTGFPTFLQSNGYMTFAAGKYLNDYGSPGAGGVAHIPPGWTDWQGLVGNSAYYQYTLSNNGKAEQHGDTYPDDYLPLVILNKTMNFLDKALGSNTPFFTYISTPSCHGPQDAEPKYAELYPGIQAPRYPNYNASVSNVHWLQDVQAVYGLDENSGAFADLVYRRRLQTLATVDDIVEALVNRLSAAGVLDNTYFIYTSDNGYHTGTFGFIYDKRQPWETDTHLPLLIRGPGIAANITTNALATMPDVSATVLDMAGIAIPTFFDGVSVLPAAVAAGTAKEGEGEGEGAIGRGMTLIEYHGETADGGDGAPCARTHGSNMFCNADGNYSWPPFFYGGPMCVCQDVANNTYACLRVNNGTSNFRYCEFVDAVGTVEYFDFQSDPYELTNLAPTMDPSLKSALHTRLHQATTCVGHTACQAVLTPPIIVGGSYSGGGSGNGGGEQE